jgi:hypothetical protein
VHLLLGCVRHYHVFAGSLSKGEHADIVHIEGDPDHPTNRGTLCPKGAALLDFVHAETRLMCCIADQPQIYAGLAKDPTISPLVQLWKRATRYDDITVMAAFAALGFLHHLLYGPNRVTNADEQNARRLRECGA